MTDYTAEDIEPFDSYHNGHSARPSQIPAELKRFIAWDGEGMNLRGHNRPQSYVLFGCSTGQYLTSDREHGFMTAELCEFITDIGERNPDTFHVGFAFGYDSNMILQSLSRQSLEVMQKTGYIRITGQDGVTHYGIGWRKGKHFRVTRYNPGYHRKHNSHAKVTVTIEDMFGFFQHSFVRAVEDMLGNIPELPVIIEGKANRGSNEREDMADVIRYWEAEIKVLAQLAEKLRQNVWGAGLKVTQWYGPGALASYALKHNGIRKHMVEQSEDIRLAARYAYAGGRFELYRLGRTEGPVYGIDVNSAYPYGIAQLPSLVDAQWLYEESPDHVTQFGVYHVRVNFRKLNLSLKAAPFFHRDQHHNISFPWCVEGWYWGPEARLALRGPGVEIIEGYHFIPSSDEKPFSWVYDTYETRRDWKRDGNASQLALKLLLNSLYGKMAQRVGWDEEKRRKPPWHQLEWAGWVTSNTRAMLYHVMRQIPQRELIAVETDGIYATTDPAALGIMDSKELGGWEVSQYDEVMYVQSGLAWLRQGDKWTEKRRGLDPGSFTLDNCRDYLRSLRPNEPWPAFVGKSTRFVGLGSALMSPGPLKVRHCVWETTDREINAGSEGKRIHIPAACSTCKTGATAYELAHDMLIRSNSRVGVISTPHNIPWEGKDDTVNEWREYQSEHEDELRRE